MLSELSSVGLVHLLSFARLCRLLRVERGIADEAACGPCSIHRSRRVEPVRSRVVIAVDGGALPVTYLVHDVDVAAIWGHYELASRGRCVQGLHARRDHLQVLQATPVADLVHTGDGIDVPSPIGRWLVGIWIGEGALPQVAVGTRGHALWRMLKNPA